MAFAARKGSITALNAIMGNPGNTRMAKRVADRRAPLRLSGVVFVSMEVGLAARILHLAANEVVW
jgi:hypothetical protein